MHFGDFNSNYILEFWNRDISIDRLSLISQFFIQLFCVVPLVVFLNIGYQE